MHDDVITWDTPEYHHFEKNTDWYWSVGIIAVSLAILCILFGNILLACFILLGAFTAGVYAAREPDLMHVELRPKGILVNDTFYNYRTLESFWVEEDEHPQTLLVKSKKILMPYIVIHLNHIYPDDVRLFLRMHLKEEEHRESLIHKFFEYFGF